MMARKGNQKAKIIIVGTGPGNGLKSLTLESFNLLRQTKEIYCRIDYEPIIRELKKEGKKIISLTPHYKKFSSFEKTYESMARYLVRQAQIKGEIVYLVPGHPLVCEHPTELVIGLAGTSGVAVQILPNMSFLDSLFVDARFEPGLGMQFVAASELFKEGIYNSLSPALICVVTCLSHQRQPAREMTVYEKFVGWLNDKYKKNHSLVVVYQDPVSYKQRVIKAQVGNIDKFRKILTTYRASCLIFPQRLR